MMRTITAILGWCAVWLLTNSSGAAAGPAAARYLREPAAWFSGDEAGIIADHILAWQTPAGGWPKNVDTTQDRAAVVIDPRADYATFDNRATTDELRFLAKRYNASGDERCRAAFQKGLKHVLAAQYANGGWPQCYPPGKGYKRHITFNDGAMVRLMDFVREAARKEDYAFLDEADRSACQRAFDRGVECILKCQIREGRLTAWCAQHDEQTFEPRPARSYEKASLSGGETVGIVELLMSLDDPSTEVRAAVEGAVAWLEAVKMSGRRVVDRNASATGTDDRDRALVADATAPPLWARFYELGTNRPLYANRDGVAVYEFGQLADALRSHYAWHGTWPQRMLERDYPAWKSRVGE
jgi:pectate lyase